MFCQLHSQSAMKSLCGSSSMTMKTASTEKRPRSSSKSMLNLAEDTSNQRVSPQWVMKDTANGSRFTQMQMKTVITDNFCLSGSYNLSCPAHCARWESPAAPQTVEKETSDFDSLWLLSVAQSERKKKAALSSAVRNPYKVKSKIKSLNFAKKKPVLPRL